jgi:hypothetical protein
MIAIGIDPGLTGAMALICTRHGLLDVLDLPTSDNGTASGSMKRWIDVDVLQRSLGNLSIRFGFALDDVQVAIERPIPMPSLPAQTIASQFDTFGVLRALAMRVGPVRCVNPRDWKSIYGLTNDKSAARACAQRLYADAPVKRVKDHNRAEAILIAHWLKREIDG